MYGIPVRAAAYAAWAGILTFVLSCLTISEMGCMAGRSFDIMRSIRNESKPKPFSNTVSEGRIFMRRYAWVTAVCLAALMASGCGNQTGQEAKQNPVSVSESAASGASEAETKSDDVVIGWRCGERGRGWFWRTTKKEKTKKELPP